MAILLQALELFSQEEENKKFPPPYPYNLRQAGFHGQTLFDGSLTGFGVGFQAFGAEINECLHRGSHQPDAQSSERMRHHGNPHHG